jgi:putative ABC transport system ATP-binding protein
MGRHEIHKMDEDQIAVWRGRNVGVIFQFFQLLPMLTCAQNVMLPMDFANLYRSPQERRERAIHLLEQVDIAEQADKLPSAASGGQRQRVAIARALANDPVFLAADEPTGNLDSKTADAVFRVFEKLVDQGKTVFMVTHDRDLAGRATRIVQLADGKVLAGGHPQPLCKEGICV